MPSALMPGEFEDVLTDRATILRRVSISDRLGSAPRMGIRRRAVPMHGGRPRAAPCWTGQLRD
jgi:hypothetical protein